MQVKDCVQLAAEGKKLGGGGKAAAKSAPMPQWTVYDVCKLKEPLLDSCSLMLHTDVAQSLGKGNKLLLHTDAADQQIVAGWLQKGKKLGEGGEAAAKSAPVPQWKVYDVRNLEEALLQHGEGRTEMVRKAVSNFMQILCLPIAVPL